jgi:hypothetical protein
MKKYIVIFGLIFNSASFFGQIQTNLPQITRSSPSVASLMNYVDTPVDLYTGVPSINLPIYNFQTRSEQINLNIGLSYHSSGISFADKASDVGLGWNLIAGGAISRTVVNNPDEVFKLNLQTQTTTNVNEFNDVYSYNFMGYTGSFLIKKNSINNTYYVQVKDDSKSNMKISFVMKPTTLELDSFTLHDEKGFKYVFDDFESKSARFYVAPWINEHGVSIRYRCAHHLTKVYDNNNQELIAFTYNPTEVDGLFPNDKDVTKKIMEIHIHGFGKAMFNYSYFEKPNSHQDAMQLNYIVIKDKLENTITKFNFSYGGTNKIKERRLLTKLRQYNKDYTSSLDHQFYYKNKEVSDDFQISTDRSGYLNLTEKCDMFYEDVPSVKTTPSFSTNDVLEKILFPTGSCTIFDYESNTYGYHPIAETSEPELYYEENETENINRDVIFSVNYDSSLNTTYQFTLSEEKKIFFKFTNDPYSYPPGIDPDPSNPNGEPQVGYLLTGNTLENPINFTTYLYFIDHACLGKSLVLAPGNYTISINTGGHNMHTTGTITLTEKVKKSNPKKWVYGSGLRIKNIAVFNKDVHQLYFSIPTETPLKVTSYDYNLFNDPSNTSGTVTYAYVNVTGEAYSHVIGHQIGYTNVKKHTTPYNGYETFSFASPYESQMTASSNWPFVLAYKNGNLIDYKMYNQNNQIIKEVNNIYQYVEEGDLFNVEISGAIGEFYTSKKAWANLTSKKTTNYFYPNGSTTPNIVQSNETFTYNSLNKQIASHTVDNSVGDILTTNYFYHTGNSTFSQNRISEIERIETKRGTNLLSESKINYSNTFANNQSYLPSTIEVKKGTTLSEVRLKNNAYDKFGHVLEVQQESGIKISYIYGYNETQPIAKIENVSYTDVQQYVSNLQTLSNGTNEGGLITALNALRANLPDAMVTTFTYKPLIGVSTMTDPKGDTITYHYDSFNRLEFVKDKDGNILSENQYHYKN